MSGPNFRVQGVGSCHFPESGSDVAKWKCVHGNELIVSRLDRRLCAESCGGTRHLRIREMIVVQKRIPSSDMRGSISMVPSPPQTRFYTGGFDSELTGLGKRLTEVVEAAPDLRWLEVVQNVVWDIFRQSGGGSQLKVAGHAAKDAVTGELQEDYKRNTELPEILMEDI
jgi:hypothetical protein